MMKILSLEWLVIALLCAFLSLIGWTILETSNERMRIYALEEATKKIKVNIDKCQTKIKIAQIRETCEIELYEIDAIIKSLHEILGSEAGEYVEKTIDEKLNELQKELDKQEKDFKKRNNLQK